VLINGDTTTYTIEIKKFPIELGKTTDTTEKKAII